MVAAFAYLALGVRPVRGHRRSVIAHAHGLRLIPIIFLFRRMKEGFENKMRRSWEAELQLKTTCMGPPQVIAFSAHALAHLCDLVMARRRATTSCRRTNPYYFNTYVMLFRSDKVPQD